jgi:hypothetical protein
MAFPTPATSANCDASTDDPKQALLVDLYQLIQKFNQLLSAAAAAGPLSGSGITGAAPLASPALTGTPTAPTPATADNSTEVATTAFVNNLLPSKFSSSLGNNGWKKYPDPNSPTGYFIEQWGQTSSLGTAANNAGATFPIPFPNAVIFVNSTVTAGGTSGTFTSLSSIVNLTTMRIDSFMNGALASSIGNAWTAKGY